MRGNGPNQWDQGTINNPDNGNNRDSSRRQNNNKRYQPSQRHNNNKSYLKDAFEKLKNNVYCLGQFRQNDNYPLIYNLFLIK